MHRAHHSSRVLVPISFLAIALLAPGCLQDRAPADDGSNLPVDDGTNPDLGSGSTPGDGDTGGTASDDPANDPGTITDPPADDPPADDPPADDPPTDDPPTDDPPADDPSVDDPPADDPPVDDPPTDDPPTDDPPTDDPADPTCTPGGSDCFASAGCCGGMFCTYDGSNYLPGSCAAPLPDGLACSADDWCLSGHCIDGHCMAEACGAQGTTCWSTLDCCGGSFCPFEGAYVPGSCSPPQPLGAPCMQSDWCISGVCSDGICASADCAETAAACSTGADCCTGLCSNELGASAAACMVPQPIGAHCASDAWCADGLCSDDGLCAASNCSDKGQECWGDFACCDGFCTWSGQAYVPGSCASAQPNGAYCAQDNWCVSGNCVDSACAPAACLPNGSPCTGGAACCSGKCNYDGSGDAPGSCDVAQPVGGPCIAAEWCESGNCIDGTCTAIDTADITFSEIYHDVFVPAGCTSGYCHGTFQSPLDLMDETSAWWSLVDQPASSSGCGTTMRVVPGDPEASELWHRVRPLALDPDGACQQKMPLGSEGLGASDAELVKQWIAQGAIQ